MPSHNNCAYVIVLLACIAGCGDSQTTDSSRSESSVAQTPESTVDPSPEGNDSQFTEKSGTAQNSESTNDAPTESTVLRQEMIEIMTAQQPNADPNEARNQVETAIVQRRKHYPEFLMVSAETEKKLQGGIPIDGSAKRIADAERFLSEYSIPLSGLVNSLLPQHKAGTLTPVRTELLAEFMVAQMKQAEDALTN